MPNIRNYTKTTIRTHSYVLRGIYITYLKLFISLIILSLHYQYNIILMIPSDPEH